VQRPVGVLRVEMQKDQNDETSTKFSHNRRMYVKNRRETNRRVGTYRGADEVKDHVTSKIEISFHIQKTHQSSNSAQVKCLR